MRVRFRWIHFLGGRKWFWHERWDHRWWHWS